MTPLPSSLHHTPFTFFEHIIWYNLEKKMCLVQSIFEDTQTIYYAPNIPKHFFKVKNSPPQCPCDTCCQTSRSVQHLSHLGTLLTVVCLKLSVLQSSTTDNQLLRTAEKLLLFFKYPHQFPSQNQSGSVMKVMKSDLNFIKFFKIEEN